MARLAIIGNPKRSYDVIRILEMLGGVNFSHYRNTLASCLYFIDGTERHIVCKSKDDFKRKDNYLYKGMEGDYCVPDNQETNPFVIFTVEDFLEKFPYKIGDMVSVPEYESNVRIDTMMWDGYTVNYGYCTDTEEWCTASEMIEWNELEEYVAENSENLNKADKESIIDIVKESDDRYRICVNNRFDIEADEGEYYLVRRKPKYPNTYEDCCKIVNANPYVRLIYDVSDGQTYSYDMNELQFCENIRRLKICRDAYWKIAGEQMGLDKPWVPDWNQNTEKYVIYPYQYLFSVDKENYRNTVLAFPTKEMRDVFYENFMDLIEECKKFL